MLKVIIGMSWDSLAIAIIELSLLSGAYDMYTRFSKKNRDLTLKKNQTYLKLHDGQEYCKRSSVFGFLAVMLVVFYSAAKHLPREISPLHFPTSQYLLWVSIILGSVFFLIFVIYLARAFLRMQDIF